MKYKIETDNKTIEQLNNKKDAITMAKKEAIKLLDRVWVYEWIGDGFDFWETIIEVDPMGKISY